MKHQQGISILILTITLLLVSTLFILFSAHFSMLQQKIANNFYANQQAFAAAQAGIEAAIPYFEANYSAITNNQNGGYLQPYNNSSTQNVTLANGSNYSFTFSNPIINNFQFITITATGINADGSASRVLSQQIYAYSTGAVPNNTLIIQGNVTLQNSAALNNTQTNSNIIAGGTISLQDNAQTTTSAGIASTAAGLSTDIAQNNTTISDMLSNDFFNAVLGVNESTLQSKANYSYTNANNTSYNFLNGVTGVIIWINQTANTATINSSTVIGSAAQPVILVINGNLVISDFATIYGLVFNLRPSNTAMISSSATINGAFASTANLQLSNSAIINYNPYILYNLPSTGAAPNYAKLLGSWKDF